MNLFIAIDGACRRNGKPDCVSSGGVLIQAMLDDITVLFDTATVHEYESTNQRGELKALLCALRHARMCPCVDFLTILTDSEYMFNAMTRNWCKNWSYNNWLTRDGNPVKNRDLWEQIYDVYQLLIADGREPTFLHIKGHCMPFGTVTANRLLDQDHTGKALYEAVSKRYDEIKDNKVKQLEYAQDLSERNNGTRLTEETLKHLVVSNVVVDAIATKAVDAADRQS